MHEIEETDKEKKPKCMLCYFVRVFAALTFVLVLMLTLYMRFVANASIVGF
jgi:hypothetical protein